MKGTLQNAEQALHNTSIVWRGMESSPALEQRIRHELELQAKAYDGILASRVVVERPSRHHRHGGHFQVKLEVSVPGQLLVVSRDPDEHPASSDAYAAVNEAFHAMRRQLEDYARVRRSAVKTYRRHHPS